MSTNKTTSLINKLLRPEIAALSAYHIPDATGMVKLDAMENPYQWSAEIKQEWSELIQRAQLNRYPDPHAQSLTKIIRTAFEIPENIGLMLGNGSDEIIQILVQTVSKPDATILSVSPGFVMYEYISLFNRVKYVPVPLSPSFELDMPLLTQQIKEHQPAIIFIAYPNNPTGNLFKRSDIENILTLAPGLVVVDEAYTAFASDSFMQDLIKNKEQYPNLLVMRTVSKMGLAGLRLGYIAGDPRWITEFDKVRLPYNINVLTQLSAEFALEHKSMLDQQAQAICEQRKLIFSALHNMNGFKPFPSEANFILFRCLQGKGNSVFDALKEQGILIKNLSTAPALTDCLRVTVGNNEENQAFLAALSQSAT
ncbi:Histidinol-phosphate aminotransferase [hydrothermal vent metagenome]|uniref:Histidinol-phosphate aminotransferase n=1 Tax=hydrothermal vent metagenome TaxID=652676 RepID=A0A3B0YAN3_9ZZZZ